MDHLKAILQEYFLKWYSLQCSFLLHHKIIFRKQIRKNRNPFGRKNPDFINLQHLLQNIFSNKIALKCIFRIHEIERLRSNRLMLRPAWAGAFPFTRNVLRRFEIWSLFLASSAFRHTQNASSCR
ncbi:MAG: hypothetical protein IJK52_07890, partial [Oscillospiraceae bacterium]|nr:hypothetical protein [Oscillospiraceae bacterium]